KCAAASNPTKIRSTHTGNELAGANQNRFHFWPKSSARSVKSALVAVAMLDHLLRAGLVVAGVAAPVCLGATSARDARFCTCTCLSSSVHTSASYTVVS